MSARGEKMKRLEELRERCQAEVASARRQLEAAEQRLAGVEMSFRAMNGETPLAPSQKAPRANVKQMILDLLGQKGAEGVNANVIVEIAASRGEHVERGTASSLLSRFKAEGLVFYDGKVYRLAKYASGQAIAEVPAMH